MTNEELQTLIRNACKAAGWRIKRLGPDSHGATTIWIDDAPVIVRLADDDGDSRMLQVACRIALHFEVIGGEWCAEAFSQADEKMDSDRELLELAAKAAGLTIASWVDGVPQLGSETHQLGVVWNPIKDKAQAFDLAVNLDLAIAPYPIYNKQKHSVLVQKKNLDYSRFDVMEIHGHDKCAATCFAIVRAAAKIGKAME